ncbi:MAG: E3 binding domain-containing protein, partial [Anaerolineales bacterium]|nr:E3 binding domain-containing protein [Anaerolineales bacterium]
MPIKVLVPLLGEGVEEVSIVTWLKAEGDAVDEFEGLLEVETDKVVTEIPSPSAGVLLKILEPQEGKVVSVGTLLAWIGEEGEALPDDVGTPADETLVSVLTETSPMSDASPPTSVRRRDSALGFISPVVAKIAAENNVDLHLVTGTGRGGRITKKDILGYLGSPEVESASAPASTLTGGTLLPMTSVRRAIAAHMVNSRRTSPHV